LDFKKPVFQAAQVADTVFEFPELNENVNGQKREDDQERFIKHTFLLLSDPG
jgi:hypothetical protein